MVTFAKTRSALTAIAFLLVTGCSGGSNQSAQEGQTSGNPSSKQGANPAGYPEIKTMVLDILHSQDGMTTIKDTISSPEFKRSAAITSTDVAAALEKSLSQGKNKSFLTDQMKDPQFAAAFVKAARTQMAGIQQDLMKDPAYQKQLLALMESPEYMKTQFTLLKSPEYRKEVMKIMTEALQEPTFRLLFTESMKEAVKSAGGGQAEKMGQQKKSQSQSSDSESKEGGGGGGGGGGGEGGESGESGGEGGSQGGGQ